MYISKFALVGALSLIPGVHARRLMSSKVAKPDPPLFSDATCQDYCNEYFKTCTNYNIYLNPPDDSVVNQITTNEPNIPRVDNLLSLSEASAQCLKTCMTWPRGIDPATFAENTAPEDAFNSNLGGDTIWCRKRHLSLARGPNEAAFHCPHGTNPSLGICRDSLVNGYTPYELLRDGADTKHRLPYCDIAGDGTVADCTSGGINDSNLQSVLKVLPATVQVLFLNGNSITSLGANAFSNLKNPRNLKALYLNDCDLTTVDADALAGLDNLMVFNADSNNVGTLDAGFLKYTPKLTQFSMFFNFNLWSSNGNKIPSTFFSYTPNLERMVLYGTAVTQFDAGTFNGLRKLQLISFVNNGEISSFPAGLFNDCVSLMFFDFFGNKITTFPQGFFGPWARKIIRLAMFNNPISSIHAEAGLENLLSIEMAYFHYTVNEVHPSQATFDIVPVAEILTGINPGVTLTYGSTY